MAAQIPARNASRYCGQYAQAFDTQRILQIFTDSHRIALSSKSPETASDRFALAVEAYHQLMTMQIPEDVRTSVQTTMQSLVDTFPTQVISNEALGIRDTAKKLKTAKKRVQLFKSAADVLERGLHAYPSSPILQAALAEVHSEIAQSESEIA